MTREGTTLLYGTLDFLILKTLSQGARHGYGIARWLERESQDQILIDESSLYPALYRLEKRGLVTARWGKSELDRRAKFYSLTSAGRARLERDTAVWATFARAVSRIMLTKAEAERVREAR